MYALLAHRVSDAALRIGSSFQTFSLTVGNTKLTLLNLVLRTPLQFKLTRQCYKPTSKPKLHFTGTPKS